MSASGSFFFTLPKSWIEKSGIKKGDRIDISVDEEGSLRLFSEKRVDGTTIEYTLDLGEHVEPTLLERRIENCYIQGCDVANIVSKKTITHEWKRMIKKFVADLIGTEISEEFSNRITIRALVDPVKFPMNELMKRVCVLIRSMHEDAIRAFRDNDPVLALDVIDREKEVDKLYMLMLRQLMLAIDNRDIAKAIGVVSVKECLIGLIAARDLSRMSFYTTDIATRVASLNGEKLDRVTIGSLINLSGVAIEMQEKAVRAFFTSDFVLANSVIDRMDWVHEFDRDITEKILKGEEDTKTVMALTTISRDIRRIASCAAAIGEDTQIKVFPMR